MRYSLNVGCVADWDDFEKCESISGFISKEVVGIRESALCRVPCADGFLQESGKRVLAVGLSLE